MTSREALKMMTKKYNWLCEQYAILTDRDEMSLKFNKKVFKDLLVKPVSQDLEVLEIIKNKVMPLVSLERNDETDGIHYRIYDGELYQHSELDEKQYDLLKEWLNENND